MIETPSRHYDIILVIKQSCRDWASCCPIQVFSSEWKAKYQQKFTVNVAQNMFNKPLVYRHHCYTQAGHFRFCTFCRNFARDKVEAAFRTPQFIVITGKLVTLQHWCVFLHIVYLHVYLPLVHGTKWKSHLNVAWNWCHFEALHNLRNFLGKTKPCVFALHIRYDEYLRVRLLNQAIIRHINDGK